MHYITYFLAFLGAFTTMEFVAWFTHKYIMHGFLWKLHKSHHQKSKGFFEWNDFFFLFFGSIGAYLIISGIEHWDIRFFIGAGITAYGLTYITLHDIIIHGRLKLFRNVNSSYLKAMQRAHKVHHSNTDREKGRSFGLLWVDRKFFD